MIYGDRGLLLIFSSMVWEKILSFMLFDCHCRGFDSFPDNTHLPCELFYSVSMWIVFERNDYFNKWPKTHHPLLKVM